VTVSPQLRLRIGDTFTGEVAWDRNDVDITGGQFVTNLARTRLSYSFSPRLFAQALVQYNDRANAWSNNFRIGWLQRLLKRPPKAVRAALAGEKFHRREKEVGSTDSKTLTTIFAVRKRLLDWNKVPARREPLDPQVRQQIIERLRDDVILLSRVIDRDLSHWLGGVPEAKPRKKVVNA